MKTILEQYEYLKGKHPDAVLLFRVGDYYESYYGDAKTAANVLGLVVTKRDDGVDVAAFPRHALDLYLPKLIRAGHRVAICDAMVEPKKLVKRGINELVNKLS